MAAYRYLVKSHEVIELVHGSVHPSLGAACLAIASVLNAIGNFVDAREWLINAISFFERLNPVPVRAIAFSQVQLSNVLGKLQFREEAEYTLLRALDFYQARVEDAIKLKHPNEKDFILLKDIKLDINPFGEVLKEDINQCFQLMEKLLEICDGNQKVYQALEQAENLAVLSQRIYGWDSEETAKYRRDVSTMCYDNILIFHQGTFTCREIITFPSHAQLGGGKSTQTRRLLLGFKKF